MPDHTGTATVVVDFAQWIVAAVALLEVSEFLPKISRFIRGLRIPGSDPELKKDSTFTVPRWYTAVTTTTSA
jgi:hypothetical protein